MRKSASAAASKVPILTLGPRCAGSGHVLYFGKGAVTGSLKKLVIDLLYIERSKMFFSKNNYIFSKTESAVLDETDQ